MSKLTNENINKIVQTYTDRKDIEHFSCLASYEQIEGNDFNLTVSTYVEAEDTREIIDINKLNAEIEEIVRKEEELRKAINVIIAEIEVG